MDREKKYSALYAQVKNNILQGVVAPGQRLPSKRELARRMGVSVVTVEHAYQQLADEGYIYARERSGYYCRPITPLHPAQPPRQEPLRLLPEDPPPPPAPDFPYSPWFRTVRRVMSRYGPALLGRSPSKGACLLRNALAAYLLRYRGMHAQPERIIVGSGSEQLYWTVVRLLGTDRRYGVEYPSYEMIEAVYTGAGAQVERLPLGPDGVRSESLARTRAGVLHVTPFHSYPSGTTAPAAKRYEYLAWAAGPDRYVVEDDFDSEFFLPGKPPETLYSMDRDGHVIYINTFSKSLAPSMRMGYMILPERLLAAYDEKFGRYTCSVPLLEQYALAEFISDGSFEQHLNRVRRRLACT